MVRRQSMKLPTLPKALTLQEKKYLLAVERGDMANVRKMLQKAIRLKDIDINCVDALGRGALTMAIEGENMEMVELLVVMGVKTRDALLQAINAEFVEAVELLLEHEELIHKDPGLHSWQKVDPDTATFTPDITPLMLAAHKNNYEIIKILLDRGATLPDPHDFVAHPNIQQLLASIWYDGVPGFRRKSPLEKFMILMRVAVMFPVYCAMYMIAPNCATGKLMRKPFMKFLIHASSYLFFLFILILVSLRAEVEVIQLFGTENMIKQLQMELKKQRGNGPTYLELVVTVYVLGFIWQETHEIYIEGIRSYLRNMWNFIDFTRNFLYVLVALLRFAAYIQQAAEISKNPQTRFIPREHWDAFDPQLIAEGLFAAANILRQVLLIFRGDIV
ncbi:jg27828 [Pararge aegeria aegeria]|uniref:Jg27828 protein n=1 Tax=Pararge aegeria aegeria TaxID=348720 RepID=A0A8S4RGR6_9NEOP|nr:jg27828 [Pararge aegeria aegeria]